MAEPGAQFRNLFLGLGILIVFLGCVLNDFVVAYLFAPDGSLEADTRVAVRAVMGALIVIGAGVILARARLGIAAATFVERRPNAATLLVALAMTAGAVASVELVFYTLDTLRARSGEQEFTAPGLIAGRVSKATLIVHGETVYDVRYSLDDRCARVTPPTPANMADKEILFFGGSFTFGEGVQDDETLPSVVAQNARGWRVTNFGFPGHGPAQMLRRLRDSSTLEPLEGSEVKLVYVFIPGHIRRVIGSMRVATAWGRHFPYYAVGADGALEDRGTFNTGRPWLKAAYSALARERILKYYEIDLPIHIRRKDLEVTARVIIESRDRFAERFDPADFYVVIYPRHPKDEFPGRDIIPFLEAAGIQYLDYTTLFDGGAGYWLDHDLHPTAKAHAVLGTRLAKDLGLTGE